MDLNYSAQEEAFRQRVRDFLKASLPQGWGSPGYIASKGDAYVDFLRGWQRRLYDHGLLGLEWPREFGGQDACLVQSEFKKAKRTSLRAIRRCSSAIEVKTRAL